MKTRTQKSNINRALKLAIFKSGKTQRVLSLETEIPEVRLSLIKTGRNDPSDKEMDALAKALGRPRHVLFPHAQDEAAAS